MSVRGRMTEAWYRLQPERWRRTHERDLQIVDEKERDPDRSLTSILKAHHRDPRAFKREVPTRKVGRRLELAAPGERRLYRGSTTMLADIDGRPQAVRVTPSNDAEMRSVQGHDSAAYAAVMKDDDSRLPRYRMKVVVDSETGQRFRFYVDGDVIREVAAAGELDLLQDLLMQSGGRRYDMDDLPDDGEDG
jgi:hypothetical protein